MAFALKNESGVSGSESERERERGGEQERILHMDCKQYIQAKEQWHVKYIAIKWYYVIIKLKKYTTLHF